MISRQQHIIDKVFVEVNTTNTNEAENIPKNISYFLENEVFPLIESLCEEYKLDENILRIDNLEIDCAVASLNQRNEIKGTLISGLRKKLDKIVKQSISINNNYTVGTNGSGRSSEFNEQGVSVLGSARKQVTTFLHFLEFGYLPWYGKEEDIKLIVSTGEWKKHLEDNYVVGTLKLLFFEKEVALNRFVIQFSNHVITDFIEACKVISFKDKAGFVKLITNITSKLREELLTEFIRVSVKSDSTVIRGRDFNSNSEPRNRTDKEVKLPAEITSEIDRLCARLNLCFEKETIIKHINPLITNIKTNLSTSIKNSSEEIIQNINNETIPESNPTIFSERIVKAEKEKEPLFFTNNLSELFIRNAGLVLFHPFLLPLFSSFGWIDEDEHLKEDSLFMAVQTLHYCATGKEEFFEANLVFEKFLCGVTLAESVPYQSLLSNEIKVEAERMIKSVIDHWSVLGNTSPEGLREAFIQRNGKLIKKDKGFRLIVEQKAMDILLDKLPWAISMIKLPWKRDLLYVDWS